jgi:hypothetical protein
VLVLVCSCGHRSEDATTTAGSSTPQVTALKEAPKPAPKEEAPKEAPRPAMPAEVTSFITPEVVGLTKATGEWNPVIANLMMLLPGSGAQKCVGTLLDKIRAAYSLDRGANKGAYYLFEGAPPRDEVEACATTWLGDMLGLDVEHEGELSVFRTGSDATYAAWQGSIAIVGSKEQVTRALSDGTHALADTWRTRLSQLPASPMAQWRSDALLNDLSGAPTTSYVVAIDRIEQVQPMPRWTGRVLAQYATAAEAAAAAKRIQQSQPKRTDPAYPTLPRTFKGKKVKQNGTTVEIAFTLEISQRIALGVLDGFLQALSEARPPGGQ